MDTTFKPALESEFGKALATLRRDPYGRLPQKQAEAIVAFFAATQPSEKDRLGWSFSEELDSFTRILPYVICAFNAIDRDCDTLVSDEDLTSCNETKWSFTELKSVEASLPALCVSGLSGPQGLAFIMEHIKNFHFEDGVPSMSLRDCVLASMKVFTELHVRASRTFRCDLSQLASG
eukprot:s1756_g9.t1